MTGTLDVDAMLRHAATLGTNWSRSARATAARAASSTPDDAARAAAERLPPSVEGHGGDAALLHAATEIGSIVGPDEARILGALEHFNARCLPPWPDAKLQREAARAAERQRDPMNVWAKRLEARVDGSQLLGGGHMGEDGWPAPVDWTAPDPPIEWYCKGLGIATSDAKVTLIGGLAGAGKGPLANYLAVCFASGRKVFGRFPVRRARVLLLDFEGARLTARRIRSHCRGLGLDAARALPGRLELLPSIPAMMHDITWLEDKVRAEGIEVLVVDSYMSAMSEIDADPNSPAFAYLARCLGALGVVVIIVAHARKPAGGSRGERPALGDIAGSYALGGYAQTAIAVWNPDDEDRLRSRVACMRGPEEPFATLDVVWTKSGTDEEPVWVAEASALSEAREDAARVGSDRARRDARRLVGLMHSDGGAHPYTASALGQRAGLATPVVAQLLSACPDVVAYAPTTTGGPGTYTLRPGGHATAFAADWPGPRI